MDVRIACQFLDDLIELEEDSFIKDRMQNRKKELMDRPKDKRVKKNNVSIFKGMPDIFAILSAILTTLGMMLFSNYVFANADTFLSFNKIIPKYFLQTWVPQILDEGIEVVLEMFFNGNLEMLAEFNAVDEHGIFWAFTLLPLGLMLGAVSRVEKRETTRETAAVA